MLCGCATNRVRSALLINRSEVFDPLYFEMIGAAKQLSGRNFPYPKKDFIIVRMELFSWT